MREPEFHLEARTELRETARFYESQLEGLGFAFMAEVEHASQLILAYPDVGTPIWRHYRRVLVRRFPYALIYRIKAGAPIIVASRISTEGPTTGVRANSPLTTRWSGP